MATPLPPLATAPSAPASLPPSPAGVRRSTRETLVAPATLWKSSIPDDTPGERIFVSNISLEGLAFRARAAYEPGAVHYVRLKIGPLHLESPVRIAWCRKRQEGIFDTGAQFVGREH